MSTLARPSIIILYLLYLLRLSIIVKYLFGNLDLRGGVDQPTASLWNTSDIGDFLNVCIFLKILISDPSFLVFYSDSDFKYVKINFLSCAKHYEL